MTPISSTVLDFCLSSSALSYALNLRGNADDVSVSVYTGSRVVAYHKDVIGYDALNYRQWTLSAFPTHFEDHVARYAHIALTREGTTALVVFPSTRLDMLGRPVTDDGTHFIGHEEEDDVDSLTPGLEEDAAHYFLYLGKISSSGEDGTTERVWEYGPITGKLDTDQYRNEQASSELDKMFSLSDLKDYIIQHLPFKRLIFGPYYTTNEAGESETYTKEITDVQRSTDSLEPSDTIVPTTAYTDHEYLSKTKTSEQSVKSNVNFGQNIKVNGKAEIPNVHGDTTFDDSVTIKGNTTTQDVHAKGNVDVEGNTIAKGNVTVGTSASLPADMQHWGKSEWGTFIKGIIGGSGAQIDINGNAELESLIIRRFLEVPELRYNRVNIHSGTEWFTKGSGLIESVELIDDTHGKVKLHLEDGEISTIAEDDYCMGIFHNLNGNAEQTTDDKQGTMQYSGFCTVYFRIQEITETVHNSEFIYELRPVSEPTETTPGWSHQFHPQPQMAFACYANPNDKDRQSAVLKTTDYTVYIENSTQWTFGPDNYYLIMGQLEGFSVWATNKKGQRYLKHLHGNGTMLDNVYIFGVLDQFDRLADTIDISASPRINADYSLADGETMTLTAQMLSYDGFKRTGVVYTIKRYSDNPESDTEWNARRGNDIKDGTIAITMEDLLTGEDVFDLAVQFTITGTRQLPSDEGGEEYSVDRDIVVKSAGASQMVINMDGDPFLAWGETKHITCNVLSPRGNADITSDITSWKAERDTGEPIADEAWNISDKAKHFDGEIEISFDAYVNDLGSNNSAVFTFTAYIGDEPQAQAILEI